MQTAVAFSNVLEHPAASREDAVRHFANRLAVETDCYDVNQDILNHVKGFVIVDPRDRAGYAKGHLPGAISIPHREIDETTTADLNRDDVVLVYCWGPGCNAGTKAGLRFAQLGFKVKEIIGGWEYWVKEGYQIEAGE